MYKICKTALLLMAVFLLASGCDDEASETEQDVSDAVEDASPDLPTDVGSDGEDAPDAEPDVEPDSVDVPLDVPPEMEAVCDDNLDDDEDGLVDCDDPDCAGSSDCPAWCEATGDGRCYYVDPVNGDDGNDGSFEAPFETYLNLVSWYDGTEGSDPPPPTAVVLQPGDVVYLMDGTHNATFAYQNGDRKSLFLRGIGDLNGDPITIAGYPGDSPVIALGHETPGMELLQSNNVAIKDLEIAEAWQRGLWISGAQLVSVERLHVHHTDGVDNANVAGIRLNGAHLTSIENSVVHDNYDRTAEDTGGQRTENSTNIVIFGGGPINIIGNHVFNEPVGDKFGGCIKYKHAADTVTSTFRVQNNRLENCWHHSVGSGTQKSLIEGNLIVDSSPISLRNWGGPTVLQDMQVRYNTLVRTPGLDLQVDEGAGNVPIEDIVYEGNVVVDDEESYNQDRSTVRISPYGSNEKFQETTADGVLTFRNNCYFNPNLAVRFDLFSAVNFGDLGDAYDLSGWQALGYDMGSFEEDPELDDELVPRSANCSDKGHASLP